MNRLLILLALLSLAPFANAQDKRGFLDQSTGYGLEMGGAGYTLLGVSVNQFIVLEPLTDGLRKDVTEVSFTYTGRANFVNIVTLSHELALDLHFQRTLGGWHVGAWGEQFFPFSNKAYYKAGPELGFLFLGVFDVSYAYAAFASRANVSHHRITFGIILNGVTLSNGPLRNVSRQ